MKMERTTIKVIIMGRTMKKVNADIIRWDSFITSECPSPGILVNRA